MSQKCTTNQAWWGSDNGRWRGSQVRETNVMQNRYCCTNESHQRAFLTYRDVSREHTYEGIENRAPACMLYLPFPSTISLVKGCPRELQWHFQLHPNMTSAVAIGPKPECLDWPENQDVTLVGLARSWQQTWRISQACDCRRRWETDSSQLQLVTPEAKFTTRGDGWAWENRRRSPEYALYNSQENANSSHINDSSHL